MEQPALPIISNNTPYWLQFFSDIIKAVIWPLLIFCIFIILYRKRQFFVDNLPSLLKFLKRTKSVKFKDASIEFSEELKEVTIPQKDNNESTQNSKDFGKIEEEIPPSSEKDLTAFISLTSINEFKDLAKLKPDYAILDSWQSVNRTVDYYFFKMKIPTDENINKLSFKRKLEMIGLRDEYFPFFIRLSHLRNSVIHDANLNVSYSDALVYREQCLQAIEILINSFGSV